MTTHPQLTSLLKNLQLEPHPLEGGYFKRTYTAVESVTNEGVSRPLASSIYYLLTSEAPSGLLHRNRSDIVHCYHGVGAIDYYLLSPSGELSKTTLGWDLDAGHQLQMVVPGGYWKASSLVDGDYGLISEVVVPGFEYFDHELATASTVNDLPADYQAALRRFLPNT